MPHGVHLPEHLESTLKLRPEGSVRTDLESREPSGTEAKRAAVLLAVGFPVNAF